jgi:hypothetical protein
MNWTRGGTERGVRVFSSDIAASQRVCGCARCVGVVCRVYLCVCTCVIPPLSVADSLPPLSGPPLAPGTDDSAGDRHLSADSVFVKGANSRANPSNHRGRAEERGTRAEKGGRLGGAVRVCSSTRMLSFKRERERSFIDSQEDYTPTLRLAMWHAFPEVGSELHRSVPIT